VIESLPTQVESRLGVQVLGIPLMQGLVQDVFHRAPDLGVAVADVGVDRRRVQRETLVRRKIVELRRTRHATDPQITIEESGLHRADAREAVRSERAEHAQTAGGGVAMGEGPRDPRSESHEL